MNVPFYVERLHQQIRSLSMNERLMLWRLLRDDDEIDFGGVREPRNPIPPEDEAEVAIPLPEDFLPNG